MKDKLISKQEFQLKRKDRKTRLKELLKQDRDVQDEVKEAIDQLERHDEYLHQALKVLIKEIQIYPDGKLDIHSSFAN
ncbi:hypothetical protein [Siminovitchia fortis]|uniref:hypothetical protein n=1 Tax=Siminovitchia fortis TaxID=254758 RepID=UPI0011A67CA1|nr:hypothetical protein [Siminovitchia fortis]